MHFEFRVLDGLPALAWCAVMERHSPRVQVYCGAKVETCESAFVEGAWSGPFGQIGFERALTFTGTGGKIWAGKLVLATATDTLQPIYQLAEGERLVFSNSLPFLLAASESEVRPDYLYYDLDIMSVMHGLKLYQRHIPLRKGRVELHYFCTLTADSDLKVQVRPKPLAPEFHDYASYVGLLRREVQAVVANASAPERRHPYSLLSSISSGYDSPACSVLAVEAGCREAVTFAQARPDDCIDTEDSGGEIAAILGLRVSEHDRLAYRSRPGLPEIEFVASGYGGDDIVASTLEEKLAGTLFFTGYHGDKIWNRVHVKASRDIVRGDPSGASLLEFRLRVGFLNLALPFIAATRHPELYRISNSPEMAPWSIGGDYDRPIPRRLAEEAGVPREMFGQSKKAITRPYQTMDGGNPPLERVLGAEALSEFRRFLAERMDGAIAQAQRRHLRTRKLAGKVVNSYKVGKLAERLHMDQPVHHARWRLGRDISESSFLFHWAIARMEQRYREALAQTPDQAKAA